MSRPERPIAERMTVRSVIAPDDESFLQELYFSIRDDLQGLFIDDKQMRELLLIQYRAQLLSYGQEFPNATHEVILLDGKPVGRVIVDRSPDTICLVDIALATEARGSGIGTIFLERLLDEGSRLGVPVELRVLKTNRAQRLYERLGFRTYADDGVRFHMRWTGDQAD